MKIKLLFLSFLILSGILFVGCEQTELAPETDMLQLAERVATNANYQKVQVLSLQALDETSSISKNDLQAATALLLSDLPDLQKLEKEVLKEVLTSASNIYIANKPQDTSKVSSCQSCRNDCSAFNEQCAHDTYCDYLHSFYACDTQSCRDSATDTYFQAIDLCNSWLYSCRRGCPC